MHHLIKKIENGMLPDTQTLTPQEKKWYEKVSHLDISSIEQEFAEEYIFHSVENVQVKMHGISLLEVIPYTPLELDLCLQILCLKEQISWNLNNPFVSFDYLDYRATLIHKKALRESSHKLFLRKMRKDNFPIGTYNFDTLIAKELITQKKNVLIVGSTGSGKTSFINSLIKFCPEDEHIIIAEDTYELNSPHENTTRFISDKDFEAYSLSHYMSYAMRMRPERIIIGELRSEEIIPYLLALNSGHKGVLSTIHANDCRDAINRLALLYKIYSDKDIPYGTLIKLAAQNIDEIIFLENKKVKEHVKVLGANGENVFLEEVGQGTYSHIIN